MKFLIVFFVSILFFKNGYSNQVEIIEIHENKSLDQMVLEKEVEDTQSQEVTEEESLNENESSQSDNNEDHVNINQISFNENNFWKELNILDLNSYLTNMNNIKSNIIQNEINEFLLIDNFDYSEKLNRDIFYSIINYFYNIGNISSAYKLIMARDLELDENIPLYKTIELNYLLATYQLEELCIRKEEINENINLKNFLREKLDIFCLLLEGKVSEADLLNVIMLETEKKLDKDFQLLYSLMVENVNDNEVIDIDFSNTENKNLIFLYSAMARIAELPLTESFLSIDLENLSLPIILNKSSPINLRLKAANKLYIDKTLSIDSLAALYQSVDFDSDQLNNPKETIINLSDNVEMIMAYYFQLINIQIFPVDRIKAIIKFWDYAKENNLEEIAYSLSYKIVQSIEMSAENVIYGPKISISYIYNQDFDKALSWIEFYENSVSVDEKSSYARILLELYSSEEVDKILNLLNQNFNLFSDISVRQNEELIYLLINILDISDENKLTNNFEFIYDERLIPSYYISENIKEAVKNKQFEKFLIFLSISINNKEWREIHPEQLQMILNGFLNYKNGSLLKPLLLEIFKNYKIL